MNPAAGTLGPNSEQALESLRVGEPGVWSTCGKKSDGVQKMGIKHIRGSKEKFCL